MILHVDQLHITEEWVKLSFLIDASEQYSIPFGIRVFVIDTIEHLRELAEDPNAGAHSFTYHQPDSLGLGAMVMLCPEALELSVIAHEATHIALFYGAQMLRDRPRATARKWLLSHPEYLPEMVGNITAHIYYGMDALADDTAE